MCILVESNKTHVFCSHSLQPNVIFGRTGLKLTKADDVDEDGVIELVCTGDRNVKIAWYGDGHRLQEISGSVNITEKLNATGAGYRESRLYVRVRPPSGIYICRDERGVVADSLSVDYNPSAAGSNLIPSFRADAIII